MAFSKVPSSWFTGWTEDVLFFAKLLRRRQTRAQSIFLISAGHIPRSLLRRAQRQKDLNSMHYGLDY